MIAKRIIVNYSVCMQPRVSSAKKLPDYCSVFHRLSTQLTMFCTSITLIREREREDREWEVENMGESYRRQMLRCCISGQRLHCRGSGVEPPSYRSNPPPQYCLDTCYWQFYHNDRIGRDRVSFPTPCQCFSDLGLQISPEKWKRTIC